MVTNNTDSKVARLRTSSITIKINKSTWSKHKPRTRDFFIRDSKLAGYYIRIRPNGKKTYCVQARLGGSGRKLGLTIGDCNLYSQDEARETAAEWLRNIKEGINPKVKIKAESAKTKTLLDFAIDYVSINKNLAESTRIDYTSRLKNCMPKLVKKPVIELSANDVVEWWKQCSGSRNYQVAYAYARKSLDVAKTQLYITRNPFVEAKILIGNFPPPNRKETHIPENQLFNFIEALLNVKVTSTMKSLILFLLLTGKRITESKTLKWADIDWKTGTITLRKTKSGKVDVIPMTKFLYAMLRYRRDRLNPEAKRISERPHPIFVFPNNAGSGHIIDIRKALKKLSNEAGLGFTLTPHDFRRTFATACEEIEMKNEEIAILLNHAKRDVTEGYIIRNIRQKRRNLETVQKYFNQHGNNALGVIASIEYETNELWEEEAMTADQPIQDDFEKEMAGIPPY